MLQSVTNALMILEILADNSEQSLIEIADRLNSAPSTAFRLLATLLDMEFVVRDLVTKRYSISPKVYRLGMSAIHNMGLTHTAFSEMRKLSVLSNETVSLGIPQGNEIMFIERIEGQQALISQNPLGHKIPIYCTALGKAYLAALHNAELRQFLDQLGAQPKTGNTIKEIGTIERELQKVRSQGYAIDDCEMNENLRCVAAAILDRRNHPVAAISIAGPAFRISLDKLHQWGLSISESSVAISKSIGWVG